MHTSLDSHVASVNRASRSNRCIQNEDGRVSQAIRGSRDQSCEGSSRRSVWYVRSYFHNHNLNERVFAARRALADAEKAHAEAVADRQGTEQRLQGAEQRVQELARRLEEEGRESSDLALLRQRLAEEMDDERKQHQQDIAERDFAADQTRKKYQGTGHRITADSDVH